MIDPVDTVTLPLTGVPAAPAIDTMPTPEPRWLVLMRQAIRDLGGATKVAARLIKPDSSPQKAGKTYNRSYVSQVQHGFIQPEKVSAHFIQAVLTAFGDGRVDCPHTKSDIAKTECHTLAALTWGQVANTGYERLDQWRACQDCLSNPANKPAHPSQPTTQEPQA